MALLRLFGVNAGQRPTLISLTWISWRVAKVAHPLRTLSRLRCWWFFTGWRALHAATTVRHLLKWPRSGAGRVLCPTFAVAAGSSTTPPRAYHSGDYEEIAWILAQLRARHPGPVIAAGVSLGGNALLRWAAEAGSDASSHVKAVAAICSPLDLAAGGHAIGRGFNRQIYTRMFLRTMVPKALRKWEQHPGLFDRDALLAARDLYAFDNVFTAPVHGFRNTEDYWYRASSKPLLSHIRVPALVVNALNDPFVPASSLPRAGEVGPCVTLWQPRHGGHVGFAQGPWPGHVRAMPDAVSAWLTAQLPG